MDLFIAYLDTFIHVVVYLILWWVCVYAYKKIKSRKNNA